MIIVKFSGGLGNQMFQYALYKALKKRYPETIVKADLSIYQVEDMHYGFELERVFGFITGGLIQVATPREYRTVTGEMPPQKNIKAHPLMEKIWAWINARTRQYATKGGKRNLIQEEPEHTVMTDSVRGKRKPKLVTSLESLDVNKNYYIDGYWQDSIYFQKVKKELKKDFVFPTLEKRMDDTNRTVAIHVRRGDYVGSEYDVLSVEYYQQAIKYIQESAQNVNLQYYVFSEDEQYIKEKFAWLGNYTFVDWNKGRDSYRDMQLMSLCKYQIIANSSFSIWSAYLNQNEDRIVCYPAKYTKTLQFVEQEEPGWKKIEV